MTEQNKLPFDLPPLAELHCHLEGAANPALVLAQAQKYGVDVSDIVLNGRYVWQDFTSFLHAYGKAASLFRTAQDYALLTQVYLEDLATQGCIYSELFIAPIPPFSADLAPEAYLEGIVHGVAAAEANTGIVCKLIVVGIRHEGPEAVLAAAQFAAQHQSKTLTGFGMAGDERMHHPKDFAKAFGIAHDAGLGITVHAGELVGPESVEAAIKHLHPSRIGHGVRAIEDQRVVNQLAQRNIVLECCPGSNIALGLYPDFASHPIIALRNAGVKVTISSDDPPYFWTSLRDDYKGIAAAFDLDRADLLDFTRNSLDAGFMDETLRQQLFAKLM